VFLINGKISCVVGILVVLVVLVVFNLGFVEWYEVVKESGM
jgi:hypothetical protein